MGRVGASIGTSRATGAAIASVLAEEGFQAVGDHRLSAGAQARR